MICTPKDTDARQSVELSLKECARVLKKGGYFVLVSCGLNEERFDKFDVSRFGWKKVHSELMDARDNMNFKVSVLIYQS